MQPTLTVSYFSDVLCVWAYAAQIKLDELRRRFGGKSVVEEAVWRCRLGFFRDLKDIADRKNQEAMASDMALPLAAIRGQIDSGAAHAALCADFDAKDRQQVEGSPTFVINEGRQKLYGDVGYRVIEASIHELLADPGERASWC